MTGLSPITAATRKAPHIELNPYWYSHKKPNQKKLIPQVICPGLEGGYGASASAKGAKNKPN